MFTNKKLYDMITEQITNENEDLREQLKTQIADRAAQTQSMAQELAGRQSMEISKLSQDVNDKVNALQNELKSEIANAAESNYQMIVQQLTQVYDAKLESLRAELLEKIDENTYQLMKVSKIINDGIRNVQKDTAVIMQTLQLILTNMMLDEAEPDQRKNT